MAENNNNNLNPKAEYIKKLPITSAMDIICKGSLTFQDIMTGNTILVTPEEILKYFPSIENRNIKLNDPIFINPVTFTVNLTIPININELKERSKKEIRKIIIPNIRNSIKDMIASGGIELKVIINKELVIYIKKKHIEKLLFDAGFGFGNGNNMVEVFTGSFSGDGFFDDIFGDDDARSTVGDFFFKNAFNQPKKPKDYPTEYWKEITSSSMTNEKLIRLAEENPDFCEKTLQYVPLEEIIRSSLKVINLIDCLADRDKDISVFNDRHALLSKWESPIMYALLLYRNYLPSLLIDIDYTHTFDKKEVDPDTFVVTNKKYTAKYSSIVSSYALYTARNHRLTINIPFTKTSISRAIKKNTDEKLKEIKYGVFIKIQNILIYNDKDELVDKKTFYVTWCISIARKNKYLQKDSMEKR